MSFNFKSSTVEQRESEYRKLAQLHDISFESYKKYFNRLTSSLGDNEEVFHILIGNVYSWTEGGNRGNSDYKKYIGNGMAVFLRDRIVFILSKFFLFLPIKQFI